MQMAVLSPILDRVIVTCASPLPGPLLSALLEEGATAVICPSDDGPVARTDEASPRRDDDPAVAALSAQLGALYGALQRGLTLAEALRQAWAAVDADQPPHLAAHVLRGGQISSTVRLR